MSVSNFDEETRQFLLRYEQPLWHGHVSWGWLQGVLARLLARKVGRKYARYALRQALTPTTRRKDK